MKLIGKTVPKIESLVEKRRAFTTLLVMREYEIMMLMGVLVMGVFAPGTLLFGGIMVGCMVVVNHLLQRYTSQLTIMIIYSSLLYLRIWACYVYYGFDGGAKYLLFNHFITAILFFPDNPIFMEVESLVMAGTYLFLEVFGRSYKGSNDIPLSQVLLIASFVRIWVLVVLLTEILLYVFLYAVREFQWYDKLFQVLTISNRKQASFMGRLCHVSKTSLNSIIPPIEKELTQDDENEKESLGGTTDVSCLVPKTERTEAIVKRKKRRILYYSSYVHSSILLLVDFHQNKQHEALVMSEKMPGSGDRNSQGMIHQKVSSPLSCKELNLGEFMKQLKARHRLIFKDRKEVHFRYVEQVTELPQEKDPKETGKKPLSSIVVMLDKPRLQRAFTYLIFYVLEELRSIGSVLVQTKVEGSTSSNSEKNSLLLVLTIKFRQKKSDEGEDDDDELPIAKRNVEMMNGTLEIRPGDLMKNIGLSVIETKIPLPIVRHVESAKEEESEGEQEEEEEEVKPKLRVLIVEDDLVNRMVLQKCCTTGLSEDSEIVCAVDGVDGLNTFQEMRESGNIDICFIDYNMPKMNGAELAREIRQILASDQAEHERPRDEPKLVLVTAMLIGKDFEGKEFFDDFFSKPIREKTIHGVFQRLERENKLRRQEEEEEEMSPLPFPGPSQRANGGNVGQDNVEGPIGMTPSLLGGSCSSIITEQSILDMQFVNLTNQSSLIQYGYHFLPLILHLLFVVPTSLTISSWFYPLYYLIFGTMKYLHRFVAPKRTNNEDKERIDRKTDILLYHLSTIFICSYLLGGEYFRFRCHMFSFAPILIIVNISLRKVNYLHTLFQVLFISFVYLVLELAKFDGILRKYYMEDVYGYPILSGTYGTDESFSVFCTRFNSVLEIMEIFNFVELVGRKIVPQFKKRKKEYILLIKKLKDVKNEQDLVISKISNNLTHPLEQMNHELHELEEKHNFGSSRIWGRKGSQQLSLCMEGVDIRKPRSCFSTSTFSRRHRRHQQKKKKKEEKRLCSFPYTKKSVQKLNLLNMNFKILFNISQCDHVNKKKRHDDEIPTDGSCCDILKIIREIVSKEKKILIKTKSRLFLYVTTSIDNKNTQKQNLMITNIGQQQKQQKGKLRRFDMNFLFSVVITNLIHNATKNTKFGSIEVTVNYSTEQKCCEIVVRDTGVGMKSEELEEVKKRIEESMSEEDKDINEILTSESIMDFVVHCGGDESIGRRRSSSISSSEVLRAIGSPSLGIGLVVCNRIVTDAMDGKLELASEDGRGMKVSVSVPCDLVI